MQFVVSSHLMQRQIRTCSQTPTFSKSYIAPSIFIFCSVPGQSEMPHTNVLQTAMTAFSGGSKGFRYSRLWYSIAATPIMLRLNFQYNFVKVLPMKKLQLL